MLFLIDPKKQTTRLKSRKLQKNNTVELQWLEHLWDHEVEPTREDISAKSGCIIRISLIFYNMNVGCVYSLESPQ